ncbi:CitMHS family transporter [Marinitenerispora sediminis]|uniref:Citrate transporter n=1 Tax=Marinitenerispora sediminis TaxID=1931232 RepID=A0A368SZW6_9ACTN|nr:citrate:proton symporter [Marinitenerispora sediminis]RCV49389.1 citrate transporter [Marinitenerispora sediminis]RCV51980.1 citrate transporter [Marinitenerispora sediminis]RCV52101.1 citrate transporter [Marinitenerispora sediminis]
MLTWMGSLTIAAVLALLLTNRVTAVVALIAAPVVVAFAAGFSASEISGFAQAGIADVAGTAAMFVFAILYFGVMRDAGMFDPLVRRVLRVAGHNPVTIAVATVLLAIVAHLDGAGATTFLIAIPALLPLYDALGMRRLVLAALVGLGAGVMNLTPWSGPTARAATTIGVDGNEIWVPMIPAQLAGIAAVLAIAVFLGLRERRRLASAGGPAQGAAPDAAGTGAGAGPETQGTEPDLERAELLRPRLFWPNIVLTAAVVGVLVSGVWPPELVFMVGLVVALMMNYPGMRRQSERINAHAQGAILMASTLLAAGVFLGVMDGSGMVEAMAHSATGMVPEAVGPGLALVVGVLGVPLSLVFGPDAYYFAVLPVLAEVGANFGISPLEMAQASIAGQETVGFPISPLTGSFYLLTGLTGVSIGSHIRFLLPWAWLASLVVLAVAVLTGVVPVWG